MILDKILTCKLLQHTRSFCQCNFFIFRSYAMMTTLMMRASGSWHSILVSLGKRKSEYNVVTASRRWIRRHCPTMKALTFNTNRSKTCAWPAPVINLILKNQNGCYCCCYRLRPSGCFSHHCHEASLQGCLLQGC